MHIIKAILIDSKEQRVSEIEFDRDDYKNISRALGCEYFEVVTYINRKQECLMVDEEGLIRGPVEHFFFWRGYPQPLAGNGLIVGTDDEGETVAPQGITVEEVRAAVDWVTPVRAAAAFNRVQVVRHAEAAIINAMGGEGGAHVIVAGPTLGIDGEGRAIAD